LSDILLSNGEAFIEFDVSLHIQWDTSYILYREGWWTEKKWICQVKM